MKSDYEDYAVNSGGTWNYSCCLGSVTVYVLWYLGQATLKSGFDGSPYVSSIFLSGHDSRWSLTKLSSSFCLSFFVYIEWLFFWFKLFLCEFLLVMQCSHKHLLKIKADQKMLLSYTVWTTYVEMITTCVGKDQWHCATWPVYIWPDTWTACLMCTFRTQQPLPLLSKWLTMYWAMRHETLTLETLLWQKMSLGGLLLVFTIIWIYNINYSYLIICNCNVNFKVCAFHKLGCSFCFHTCPVLLHFYFAFN